MAYRCLSCDLRFDTAQPVCPSDGGAIIRDRAGQILADRYVIQSVIGAGNTGSVVWDAMQTGIHRPVAVKILPAGDEEAHTRFARGAWLAARLDHDHIATIHDAGFTPGGESFLVMERLYGQPLSARIAAGRIPLTEITQLLDHALQALAHAHARQVVHCDLKPDNLFLDEGDRPHLSILDFGIARVPKAALTGAKTSLNEIPGVDLTDGIAGTPRYMAPEQIRGAPVDGRADLYALGAVAFEMLTGRPPYPGDDPDQVLLAHLGTPVPDLPGVPTPVAQWVRTALAKDPAERHPDAVAMRTALTGAAALSAGPPPAAAPVAVPGLVVRADAATPPPAPAAPSAPATRWRTVLGGAALFAAGWAVGHFM